MSMPSGRTLSLVFAAIGWAICGCSERSSPPPPTATPESRAAIRPSPIVPSAAATRPLSSPADHDGWTVEPADGGRVHVRHRHAELASLDYLVFGPNWQWVQSQSRDEPPEERTQPFRITAAGLGLVMAGRAEPTASGELTVHYAIQAVRNLSSISGVGVEWNLRLSPDLWAGEAPPVPVLLEGGRGFTLDVGGGDQLQVTFSGLRPQLHFERNDPSRIRVMFLQGDVKAGHYEATMTVRLPKGGRVLDSVARRYGARGTKGWASGALAWNDWPVDVSFLSAGDRPAGQHGHLQAVGDTLQFEDGTPARFWGTNVAANGLFHGDHEAVLRQAKRLSALGYNLVRLHHHDAAWIDHNIFSADGTSQSLDDDALEHLDWWIKCLQDQGIYVWVDLHVSRTFMPGDGLSGFDELERTQQGEAKGFNYVNPRIEQLMQQFAHRYMSRRNRHTGRTWATDPGIVTVLVTNENDLTDHFGNLFLKNKGNPRHQALFEQRAADIARRSRLPMPQSLRTWEPGPSKILLADLQHRFDVRAIQHLRKLGVQAPIATTSYWGRGKLYSLTPLLGGDIIDVHSYGESEALSRNPRYAHNWIHFIATASLVGKPLTVSEWNVPPPERDRFTAPLYVASVGALQGWDALLLYAYTLAPIAHPGDVGEWSSWTDPSLTALSPAAAVLYRRGDVRPAERLYVVQPTAEDVYRSQRNAENSATIRTLTEQSRLQLRLPDLPELDWDTPPPLPAKAEVVTDLDRDFIEPGQTAVVSDTGELRRDWVAGVQVIDTPRSQAASGWVGGRRIETRDAMFDITTPKATVALTSLDGRPIATSKLILVTAVGRSVAGRGGTYRSEPVEGTLRLRSQAGPLGLVPLSGRTRATEAGLRGRVIKPGRREGDLQLFPLPRTVATHWFLLQPAQ